MTLAVKYALDNNVPYDEALQMFGRKYQHAGYGYNFCKWILSDNPKPYNSWGNGSAMRVSYVGEHFEDLKDVQKAAKESAEVTHNHPEGIKGAIVTATCIWMARHGKTKQEIYNYVLGEYPEDKYEYSICRSMEWLKENYVWNESCQGSVPVAMRCFIDSNSYEEFLRNVYALDSDSDTLAAIGGAVTADFYGATGFPDNELLELYLDEYLLGVLRA